MESESADNAGEAVRGAPLIFVSDASAEAERLTTTLRARGYVVTDVPLSVLPGRVAVQRPDLVLFDADADGFAETLGRLRDGSEEAPVPVVLLGDLNGPIARLEGGSVAAVFARPVNSQELLGTVERLIGAGVPRAPKSFPPSARSSSRVATSSRPPRPSLGPTRAPSDRVRTEGVAALPLPPDLSGDPIVAPRDSGDSGDAPTVELSAEVQQILSDAEARLREGPRAPASAVDDPGLEIETESALDGNILAALDEPLDDEDLPGEGTPAPSMDGTGAVTGSKADARGITAFGGTASGGTEAHPGTVVGSIATGGTDARPFDPRAVTNTGAQAPSNTAHGGTEDDRVARQRASTPRPPKLGAEGLEPGLSSPPRPTSPPATTPDPALSDSPLSVGTNVSTSSSLRHAPPTEPPGSAEKPPSARPRLEMSFDSDPPERRDQSSTTPPVRHRDDAREAEPPPSERPGAKTEPPARHDERPSESEDASGLLELPAALRTGDAIAVVANAIVARYTGALAFEVDEGIRRVVFRDGDFVTVTSGVHAESLVAFLVGRGDLPAEVGRQSHKLPAFGRRAGAALIAHGHLAQDQLWPVLRGHAEWLVGKILSIQRGTVAIEDIDRLKDEPAVFGGATGAEVLVEVARRVVPVDEAVERLGGENATLTMGDARALLAECALVSTEAEHVQHADHALVRDLTRTSEDASFGSALLGLVALGVLRAESEQRAAKARSARPIRDEIDDDALRTRILARKALVDDGDYFAVLGVDRDATSYDIRRAYSVLRKELDPHHALTANTADLGDTVDEIVAVLEEAYQILSDQRRRERYRRAIEASP